MAAPKGNQFWRLRSSHGRKPKFDSAESLWAACCEYFDAIEGHPLQAAELVKYQGKTSVRYTPKMRAMTIAGLCIFLDIDIDTWHEYRKKKDFSIVATRVEQIIKTQKFEGAAAEMLNPNIIARDLGLADKSELTGQGGEPLKITVIDYSRIEKEGTK